MLKIQALLCALAVSVSACRSSGDGCTYDTDCPELGYVCDPTTKRCVVDPRYEYIKNGECRSDSDCDQVLECCDNASESASNKCVLKPESCGKNADCPAGKSCQVLPVVNNQPCKLLPVGDKMQTRCFSVSGSGVDNTGEPCSDLSDCFSMMCEAMNNYCIGVCTSDSDCPTYRSGDLSCTDDSNCNLEQLCVSNKCVRPFECATTVIPIGQDGAGQLIIGTVDLCRPLRRSCALDSHCREAQGEVCALDVDQKAENAVYSCHPAGGPAGLGEACTGGGLCRSGMCLVSGASDGYCSKACLNATDCGDPGLWDCLEIRVAIRPDFISSVLACIRL